ncbi:PDZ domain-containing protein [candidate division KSB1 bacterium]|nr:PDZ domain-containing protein [candidate division KSB1 bacterium]
MQHHYHFIKMPFTFLIVLLFISVFSGGAIAGERAWLGVYLGDYEPGDKGVSHYGAVIERVVKDSPAEKAGLKEGDVIIKVDNKAIRDADDVTRDLRKLKPGDKVQIHVIRGEKDLTFEAELGAKPDSEQIFSPRKGRLMINLSSPYLGVEMQDLNPDLAEYFKVKADEGVLVTRVMEDSPAEKAGLKAGDIITEFDGKKISEVDDLSKAVRKAEKDEEVEITYVRKGRQDRTRVKLEADKKRLRIFGDYDDDEDLHYFYLPDKSLRIELDDLHEDLKEGVLRLKKELPREIELDFRWHQKENMESLREEMLKLKEEMKELKKKLKEELQEQ